MQAQTECDRRAQTLVADSAEAFFRATGRGEDGDFFRYHIAGEIPINVARHFLGHFMGGCILSRSVTIGWCLPNPMADAEFVTDVEGNRRMEDVFVPAAT